MRIPSMMDIKNTAVRRTVLVVFLVPATVVSITIQVVIAIADTVRELPDAIISVWRGSY